MDFLGQEIDPVLNDPFLAELLDVYYKLDESSTKDPQQQQRAPSPFGFIQDDGYADFEHASEQSQVLPMGYTEAVVQRLHPSLMPGEMWGGQSMPAARAYSRAPPVYGDSVPREQLGGPTSRASASTASSASVRKSGRPGRRGNAASEEDGVETDLVNGVSKSSGSTGREGPSPPDVSRGRGRGRLKTGTRAVGAVQRAFGDTDEAEQSAGRIDPVRAMPHLASPTERPTRGRSHAAAPTQPSDSSADDADADADASKAKRRFLWTEDLHRRFVCAMFDFGVKNATPKTLFELMQPAPSEMSSDHIKSHLQKFRNNTHVGRDMFLRDFERARKEAEMRVAEYVAAGRQQPFPVHFSTYPFSMQVGQQQEPPAAALPDEAEASHCARCTRFANLLQLGVGLPEREEDVIGAAGEFVASTGGAAGVSASAFIASRRASAIVESERRPGQMQALPAASFAHQNPRPASASTGKHVSAREAANSTDAPAQLPVALIGLLQAYVHAQQVHGARPGALPGTSLVEQGLGGISRQRFPTADARGQLERSGALMHAPVTASQSLGYSVAPPSVGDHNDGTGASADAVQQQPISYTELLKLVRTLRPPLLDQEGHEKGAVVRAQNESGAHPAYLPSHQVDGGAAIGKPFQEGGSGGDPVAAMSRTMAAQLQMHRTMLHRQEGQLVQYGHDHSSNALGVNGSSDSHGVEDKRKGKLVDPIGSAIHRRAAMGVSSEPDTRDVIVSVGQIHSVYGHSGAAGIRALFHQHFGLELPQRDAMAEGQRVVVRTVDGSVVTIPAAAASALGVSIPASGLSPDASPDLLNVFGFLRTAIH